MYIISSEPQYIVCINQKYSDGLAYKIEKKGGGDRKESDGEGMDDRKKGAGKKRFLKKLNQFL